MEETKNKNNSSISDDDHFISELKDIVATAKQYSYQSVNIAQVVSNWLIGRRIVEQEKQGVNRADYGKYVVKLASESLTNEFGKGYSLTNVKNFVAFYRYFKGLAISQTASDLLKLGKNPISQTASDLLTIPFYPNVAWSHYEQLIRVCDAEARLWYLQETAREQWSVRTLHRNISSQYYFRLMQSSHKNSVEIDLKTEQITHQDAGQMDMYVRMYDKLLRTDGDNPTIGLLLCSDTSKDMARYIILNGNEQIFQAKYLTYLPTKEELSREIEQQKEVFRLQHDIQNV